MKLNKITILLFILMNISCMRYLTHDRDEVLLEGIDLDQSLKVAVFDMELKDGKFGTSLPIWILRDQIFKPEQAMIVKDLYIKYIGRIEKDFDIWHLTWAISNIYRLGDDDIKAVLEEIIEDVRSSAKTAGKISIKMSNPKEKLFMGDAHGGGRGYAKNHVVVPGNKRYLQSFDEYYKKKSSR